MDSHKIIQNRFMQSSQNVGSQMASYLHFIGVKVVFGVISIHNMPILDAIAQEGKIRFIPARGEAGAMNMADAYARVSQSLGVVITSTGTAAGNAAGSQIEALNAGTSLLHITTQVDSKYMDQDKSSIHEPPHQPTMLQSISKAYYRIWSAQQAISVLAAAVSSALSPPMGPVSVEVPIDVQKLTPPIQQNFSSPVVSRTIANEKEIKQLAHLILQAKRPLLWFGGGAKGSKQEIEELMKRGFCAVTSTNGRAVVSEQHPKTLGAFNMTPEAQKIYKNSDLMLVIGSKLRGNETLNYQMTLPTPLIQIDADASQGGKNYPVNQFIHGDAQDTLQRLLKILPQQLQVDRSHSQDIATARLHSEQSLKSKLGVYQPLAEHLLKKISQGQHVWVRDVTISNSTFGNRYIQIAQPHHGVHALGGGIGQGIAMGIGAALANPDTKTVALLGDGGAMLGLAELITAVEEKTNLLYLLMNDQAYGVIQNIQEAQYERRFHYSKLKTPNFQMLCHSIQMPYLLVNQIEHFAKTFDQALAMKGTVLLEVDMQKIGSFTESFAGPPAGAGNQ